MATRRLTGCLLGLSLCFSAVLSSNWDIPDILQNPEIDLCKGNVKNCYCTDRVIDCKGANLDDISSIYQFVSINISRISITGGRFVEIPDGLFKRQDGKAYNSLTYLDLSDNDIESMGFDAFKYLTSLTTLDLSNNKIKMDFCQSKMYDSPFKQLKDLKGLRLHNTFDVIKQEWPCEVGDLFTKTYLPKLTSLDLSSNGLVTSGKLFTDFLCNNSVSIESLNLKDNKFRRFVVPLCMENLENLDYSNNSLEFLTPVEMDVIDSFVILKKITLSRNPFRCDCSFIDTQDWMNSTQSPLDRKEIKCSKNSQDPAMTGKSILKVDLNATVVCEEPRIIICTFGPVSVHLAKSTFIAIIVASCILLAVGVACVILLIRRKRSKNRPVKVPTEPPKDPPYEKFA